MTRALPPAMKAARLHAPGQPLVLEEVPVVPPGHGEVLMQVRACGICGSDLHMQQGLIPTLSLPITLGHEAAGVVAAVGEGVLGWQAGDRVVAVPAGACGACRYCRLGRPSLCLRLAALGTNVDGAFAEYLTLPAASLVRLPPGIAFAAGALAADAVSTPYHALFCRARLQPMEAVAVIGCGGLGSHAVRLATALGGGPVAAVDPAAAARQRALRWGAQAAAEPTPEGLKALLGPGGPGPFDVILDFVGSSASLAAGLRLAARGARLVIVGLDPSPLSGGRIAALVATELTIMGSFGSDPRDVEQVLALAAAGRLPLQESVERVVPLSEVNAALIEMAGRRGDYVRYVVAPGGDAGGE